MEKKIKHLEFIQLAITRMSSNSFLIKGWTVTLTSALFALAAKDSNANFALIAYLITPVFWYLNGFFLMHERKFRELYNQVRTEDESEIDFRMTTDSINTNRCTLISSLFSKSIWPLYILIMVITYSVIIFFRK